MMDEELRVNREKIKVQLETQMKLKLGLVEVQTRIVSYFKC